MDTTKPLSRRLAFVAVSLLATTALTMSVTPTAAAESGGAMIFVSHKVENYDKWKPVFDSTAAWKPKFGWKSSTVMSIDGDQNNVLVIESFESIEKAKAFATSAELRAAMGKAGVMGPPDVRFYNVVGTSKP